MRRKRDDSPNKGPTKRMRNSDPSHSETSASETEINEPTSDSEYPTGIHSDPVSLIELARVATDQMFHSSDSESSASESPATSPASATTPPEMDIVRDFNVLNGGNSSPLPPLFPTPTTRISSPLAWTNSPPILISSETVFYSTSGSASSSSIASSTISPSSDSISISTPVVPPVSRSTYFQNSQAPQTITPQELLIAATVQEGVSIDNLAISERIKKLVFTVSNLVAEQGHQNLALCLENQILPLMKKRQDHLQAINEIHKKLDLTADKDIYRLDDEAKIKNLTRQVYSSNPQTQLDVSMLAQTLKQIEDLEKSYHAYQQWSYVIAAQQATVFASIKANFAATSQTMPTNTVNHHSLFNTAEFSSTASASSSTSLNVSAANSI